MDLCNSGIFSAFFRFSGKFFGKIFAFWGPNRHFVASTEATEVYSVDSKDLLALEVDNTPKDC